MDSSSSSNVPKPRGRASLIAQAKQILIKPGESSVQEPAPPSRPIGRANLLEKCRRIKELASKQVQIETESTTERAKAVESISASTSKLSLQEPISKQLGTSGINIKITANYVRLTADPKKAIWEHEVKFNPECDATHVRSKLINVNLPALGGVKIFDGGSCLFLPQRVETTSFETPHPLVPSTMVEVTVIPKRERHYGDPITLRALNIFFKRIMGVLKMKRMGQHHFNTVQTKLIPQYQLEVLPGYVTAVEMYDGGLMLCLDACHKVLRTLTVLEHIRDIFTRGGDNTRQKLADTLIGQVVLTRYNNKTYTIDDILWDLNPQHTFTYHNGQETTFVQYYKEQYGIEIKQLTQPLLLNVTHKRMSGTSEKQEFKICLVPELCYLTGLSDDMRKDNKLMKEVAAYTRLTPPKRIECLRTYVENVNKCPEAKKILSDWGLALSDATIDLNARLLPNEEIIFGNQARFPLQTDRDKRDWGSQLSRNSLVNPVDITSWLIIFSDRNRKCAEEFITGICGFSKSFGCRITQPKMCPTKSERTSDYRLALESNYHTAIECIVVIVSSQREDLYQVVKKVTLCNKGVISQIMKGETLTRNKNPRSVMLSIARQMITKLGGSLWALKFPSSTQNWMICGIDTFHNKGKKQSVGALVCSIDDAHTRYHTSLSFQGHEISDSLRVGFSEALKARQQFTGRYPEVVVVIRDGVSDSQLQHVKDYEIPQYTSALREVAPNSKMCFVVVQKRINTRLIVRRSHVEENAPAGTIVDHTITKRQYNSFYMVPQAVSQGTVTPTHYVVLENEFPDLTMDRIQKLCYKLCFLYYNFSGSIRVPAPCQYAHKAAFLAGQFLEQNPSGSLQKQLYYL